MHYCAGKKKEKKRVLRLGDGGIKGMQDQQKKTSKDQLLREGGGKER